MTLQDSQLKVYADAEAALTQFLEAQRAGLRGVNDRARQNVQRFMDLAKQAEQYLCAAGPKADEFSVAAVINAALAGELTAQEVSQIADMLEQATQLVSAREKIAAQTKLLLEELEAAQQLLVSE